MNRKKFIAVECYFYYETHFLRNGNFINSYWVMFIKLQGFIDVSHDP
jgi:hypothetical protein